MNHPHKKRSSFSGSIGFVLAAAGSSVGLGNIWRFPYLAAKYGGGIFLLIYILLVLTFGFTLLAIEISIGRKTGLSAVGAFRTLNKKYTFIGVLALLVSMIILPYYSVIAGWVIEYFITYLSGGGTQAAQGGFFEGLLAKPIQPIVLQAVFIFLTGAIILKGVEKGIEKMNKILMPLLILLSLIITIYCLTQPGAMAGVKYYLIPDFSHLSIQTLLGALGQMFYSLSLAMGIMITYGSYMPKNANIAKSIGHIELFDTGIAVLAGLMIIPAVFVFSGGDASQLNQGPGLMFVTLPKVFSNMAMGGVIGVLFFLLVFFAAITSSVSMMESIVAGFCDQFHLSRKASTIYVSLATFLLGVPVALGYNVLDFVKFLGMNILDMADFVTNSVLMPVCAFFTCIFIAYVAGTDTVTDEIKLSGPFRREGMLRVMVKYIAPVLLLVILGTAFLNLTGVLHL